jgi:ribosomal protein L11 methyltransferase
MTQTRLFLIAKRPQSTALYAAMETHFEDDGFPLSSVELDEDNGIDELSVYVDNEEIEDAEARIRNLSEVELEIQREELPDVDWVAKSLEGLKPVRAGRFLVHGRHDREEIREGDIAIEIEAGQAFGTGHHGTTAGCLEMIASVVEAEQPKKVLDLGTGSAVLAIAVAKIAPIPVLATDIDPVATDVAQENVELNGVAEFVTTATAAGFDAPIFAERGPFDLIIANILANPLIQLAPEMATQAVKDGSLILSGILDTQCDGVITAYVAAGFRHIRTTHLESWVTIHLKR